MNSELASQITATHQRDLKRVEEFTKQIGKAISEKFDQENPDELVGKLNELASLQATASYSLALSEQLYNEKIAELTLDARYQKLSATDKKMLFAGLAKTENYFVTINERYSKNLSYSIESLRSILSFKKSEMELAKFQQT